MEMGLVDHVSSEPMADARVFAAKMAALAPLSIEGAKRILTGLSMGPGALNEPEATAFIDRASESEDYREGRQAFAEKRPPRFRGK